MQQHDITVLFQKQAAAVQGIVNKIHRMSEAFTYTADLTRRQGSGTVAAPGLGTEAQSRLKKACERSNLQLLEFPLRPHVNEIHTSLTLADWGIAETGSLVLDSSSEDVRIATMLAETHVAVLPAAKIKLKATDLENELNAILKQKTPSYIAFITGASRTADIERVLAIGVHGPQELHILILEGKQT
jgi:L-lactate dehydrogenase complex protein LldG